MEYISSFSFPRFKRDLRYGVIYVVTSLICRENDIDRPFVRAVSPQMLRWLESLTGYKIEIVESPEVERTTLMARRINVGNIGKDAVVEMPLGFESLHDIQRFAESAIDVLSTEMGDKVLESEPKSKIAYNKKIDADSTTPRSVTFDQPMAQKPTSKHKRSWLKWLRLEKYSDIYLGDADIHAEPQSEEDSSETAPPMPLEVDKEEDELLTIEQQQAKALQAIQAQILEYVRTYQADPEKLMQTLLEGKFVITNPPEPSPLVVNNDLKIVLPHYNEVEVKMPAMCRTIYILFLLHPEGIALRDIADYRNELENIYSLVKPGRDEELAKAAIDNLLDPMSNTLNEYISKIKRCFKAHVINDELASNYLITGKRGEPYKVNLDPELITLPRAVKRN
ncbi:MAG: hypothetical protein IKX63_03295 [Muribaculaceae bacterium]|nr:hypothetical protein [Muribaculaceae bacterium]